MVDLNPTRGHEQSGRRPALIISTELFNKGPADLVVALPLTSRDKRIPLHVAVEPPEGGLRLRSFIKCEDIRSLSKGRLSLYLGDVSSQTLTEVEDKLRILLEL